MLLQILKVLLCGIICRCRMGEHTLSNETHTKEVSSLNPHYGAPCKAPRGSSGRLAMRPEMMTSPYNKTAVGRLLCRLLKYPSHPRKKKALAINN